MALVDIIYFPFILHAFFNKQHFYKQHQAEIDKKLSKS